MIRSDDRYGLNRETADRLRERANSFERKITKPGNADDPRWLLKFAEKLRCMAERRQKGKEEKAKQHQRPPKRRLEV